DRDRAPRPRIAGTRCEPLAPLARAAREEALEHPSVGRQTRDHECGRDRRRGRDPRDLAPRIGGRPQEAEPRVGDGRHARIGDERDPLATAQAVEQLVDALSLVALEQGEHPHLDPDVLEQAPRPARVLGRHEIDGGERLACAVGEIGEVADRRAHHIEVSAHVSMVPRDAWRGTAERRGPRGDAATVPDVTPSGSSAGHRDYSATPLAHKLGIREGSRVLVVGAPSGFSLRPMPTGASFARAARGPLDVVLLFTTTLADLRRRFPATVRALDPAGRLWVAWPKK